MSTTAPRTPRGGGRGRGTSRTANTSNNARNAMQMQSHGNAKLGNPFLKAPATQQHQSTISQPRSTRGGGGGLGGRGGRIANNGVKTMPRTQNIGGEGGGKNSKAWYERRYEVLRTARDRERTEAIAAGKLADPNKRRRLSEAIVVVGTCEDMCPEFERVQRTAQNDVWAEEADPATADLDTSQRIPDETRMVKRYKRAAAGEDEQLPSDLRPAHVLKQTCDYLFHDVLRNAPDWSVHPFIWNRTRAIRNDFSIQQFAKPAELSLAIECFERIARFHLLSLHQCSVPDAPDKYDYQQDREQLDRTLVSLMQYYDDSRGRILLPNEAEFRAYSILFQLQSSDLEDRVQAWPREVVDNQRVQIALKIASAAGNTEDLHGPMPRHMTRYVIAQQHWQRFWELVRSRSVSYLMGCAAELHFQLVRRLVLNSLLVAFRASKGRQTTDWTLEELCEVLNFDSEDDVIDFCQHYGFEFRQREDGLQYIDLNSTGSTHLPAPSQGLKRQMKSDSVELKRFGRTWAAIIDGLNVSQARRAGEVEEVHEGVGDVSMQPKLKGVNGAYTPPTQGDEDDEESLFIPESKQPRVEPADSRLKSHRNGFGESKATFQPIASSSAFGQASAPFNGSKPPSQLQSKEGNASPISAFGQPSTAKPAFNFLSQPSGANAGPATLASSAFNLGKASSITKEDSKPAIKPADHPAPSPFPGKFNPTGAQVDTVKSVFYMQSNQPHAKALPTFDFAKPSTGEQKKMQPFVESAENSPEEPHFPPSSQLQPAQAQVMSSPNGASGTWQNPWAPSSTTPPQESEKVAPSPSAFGGLSAKAEAPVPSYNEANVIPKPPPSFTFTSTTTKSQTANAEQATPTTDTKDKAHLQRQNPRSYSISKDDTDRPKKSSPLSANSGANNKTLPLAEPKPKFGDIIARLAEEIAYDPIGGFLKQYIDFTVSSTITDVQETLWIEQVTEEADTFRKDKLCVRYGRLWRDICRRRRLERKAREARERRRLGASRMSSRRSSITSSVRKERSPEDRTRVVDSLFRSLATPRFGPAMAHDSRQTGAKRPASSHTGDDTIRLNKSQHKRIKSNDGALDRSDRSSVMGEAGVLGRSSFLGFSLSRSLQNNEITKSTTKTNYFRLKALGINPASESALLREKKRKRSASITSEAMDLPNGTQPESLESQQRIIGHTQSPLRMSNDGESSKLATTTTSRAEKAKQEDEELFARLRAAREGLKGTTDLFQNELAKEEEFRRSFRSSQGSNDSPSLQRARAEARWRATNTDAADAALLGDVPAYRLRESKFVPREHYGRAIDRAREFRESRSVETSRPNSRADSRGALAQVSGASQALAKQFPGSCIEKQTPSMPDSGRSSAVPAPSLRGLRSQDNIVSSLAQTPHHFQSTPSTLKTMLNSPFGQPSNQLPRGDSYPPPLQPAQLPQKADFTSGFPSNDAHRDTLQAQRWTANSHDTAAKPTFGFNFATNPPDTSGTNDFTIKPSQIEESLSASFTASHKGPSLPSVSSQTAEMTYVPSVPAPDVVSLLSSDDEGGKLEAQMMDTNGVADEATDISNFRGAVNGDLAASYGHANPFALLAGDDEYEATEDGSGVDDLEGSMKSFVAEQSDAVLHDEATETFQLGENTPINVLDRYDYTQKSDDADEESLAKDDALDPQFRERYDIEDREDTLPNKDGYDETGDEESDEDIEDGFEEEDFDEEGEEYGDAEEDDDEESEEAHYGPAPSAHGNAWGDSGGNTADAPIELDSD